MTAVHRLITPAGSNMLCAGSKCRRRKTSLPCYWVWFSHWCGVGLSSRHKNSSTGRSSYVVRDGMCWTLQPYSTLIVFSHFRYFPLYFWWFIFNFRGVSDTFKCCFETFVHGEEVVLIVRVQVKYCSIRTTWTAGVHRLGTAVASGIMGKTRGVILQSVCRRL